MSVMSTLGAVRRFLPQVLAEGREFGSAHNDEVLETGDLARSTNRGHECHMYRWSELSDRLSSHGEIVCASAANFVTAQHDDALEAATDAERAQVLSWELELCREPAPSTPAPTSSPFFERQIAESVDATFRFTSEKWFRGTAALERGVDPTLR